MASVALPSKDHRDLLDIIDKLRSKGISRYVDLPQIVVCGDQSAGKSSVLEAISGMSFPTKDNLCTRFATELVLRRHVAHAVKVSINPGPDRSAEERERLSLFSAEVNADAPDIGSVVDKAREAMGLSDTKVFSSDILRVELCGPSQPHLTMVDLPGLFRAGNRDQSVQDAEIVRKLVRGYVERRRSIILAVVSAKSDFALQEITEVAREVDPRGVRTLGLITKPDALDAGSDSEASYIKLAQNKDVVFRLGWHVLKNRDYKMREATSAERDEAEAEFFSTGAWTTLKPSHLGVKSLKPRLSNVLKDQILQQLPDLLHDVETEISMCKPQLERLGTPRITLMEQRKYLLQVSRDFTLLMKAAVDGEYSNPFFGSARTVEGYRKRLRARVQNTLAEFEEKMRAQGHYRSIVETELGNSSSLGPKQVSRSTYIDDVKHLMSRSRARELPGTFNPLIISELFAEQCQPWKALADDVENNILQVVDDVADAIADHVALEETKNSILCIIGGGMDGLKKELSGKFKELLLPHTEGHPITYNHYLTDSVQRAQAKRRKDKLEIELERIFKAEGLRKGCPVDIYSLNLLNKLTERTEVDMERFGSELAINYMQAYYKVALKKFIDDVSVLAVERCLVNRLPHLFQAESVLDLKDEEVTRLAGETESASAERERYIEKLAILESGQRELRRLGTRQPLDAELQNESEPEPEPEPELESESEPEPVSEIESHHSPEELAMPLRTLEPDSEPEPEPDECYDGWGPGPIASKNEGKKKKGKKQLGTEILLNE